MADDPETQQSQQNAGLPMLQFPPSDIFRRSELNHQFPANDIWGGINQSGGTISYIPERAEYIDGEGNFVYWVGCKFPSRCVAPPPAILAINPIKRLVVSIIRILASRDMLIGLSGLLFIGKKGRTRILQNVCERFISIADITLDPFYLKKSYYCPIAKEVLKFMSSILMSLGVAQATSEKVGEIFAAIIEFDNAYRWRIQDVLGETTKDALQKNFQGEITRLIKIEREREARPDFTTALDTFQKVLSYAKIAYRIPSVKRIIQKAVKDLDLSKCVLEEGDFYHMLLFGDYNAKGKTLAERIQIYSEYHGTDTSKWPPRILIRST